MGYGMGQMCLRTQAIKMLASEEAELGILDEGPCMGFLISSLRH